MQKGFNLSYLRLSRSNLVSSLSDESKYPHSHENQENHAGPFRKLLEKKKKPTDVGAISWFPVCWSYVGYQIATWTQVYYWILFYMLFISKQWGYRKSQDVIFLMQRCIMTLPNTSEGGVFCCFCFGLRIRPSAGCTVADLVPKGPHYTSREDRECISTGIAYRMTWP